VSARDEDGEEHDEQDEQKTDGCSQIPEVLPIPWTPRLLLFHRSNCELTKLVRSEPWLLRQRLRRRKKLLLSTRYPEAM
jgi:hypothetical protein